MGQNINVTIIQALHSSTYLVQIWNVHKTLCEKEIPLHRRFIVPEY